MKTKRLYYDNTQRVLITLILVSLSLTMYSQGERQWIENVSRPYDIRYGLKGKNISLWASHGRYYDNKKGVWKWQRPRLYCTTEDVFTQTFVVPYIIPMLEKAGATVFTPRERDWQTEEIIVDNDNAETGYSEENGEKFWEKTQQPGYSTCITPYKDFDRPFLSGTARKTPTTSGEDITKAYYRPNITKEGEYAVYVAYQTIDGAIDDAEYTVVHGGIKTRFRVNQQMASGTWVYLGTFYFQSGKPDANHVMVTNRSARKGFVTTDAVRFGGGMGNHFRGGTTSGVPRAMEASRYWAQYSGAPPAAVFCKGGIDDYSEDINVRSLMSNWLSYGSRTNPTVKSSCPELSAYLDSLTFAEAVSRCYADSLLRNNSDSLSITEILSRSRKIAEEINSKPFQEINVCRGEKKTGHVPFDLTIGLHSDAGYHADMKSVYGSLTICTTDFNNRKTAAGTSRLKSFDMACNMLHNIQEDMTRYLPQWAAREVRDRNYSESRLPAQESMLLEMLSHESFPDMRYGHDPYFKFLLSRTVYKTLLRHIARRNGRKTVIQPLPPRHFSAGRLRGNTLTLSWKAREDSLEPSATPTSYNIYTRVGDGDYDNGTNVQGCEYTIALKENTIYRFRISAINDGGESFPTEELVAMYVPKATETAMIINAFHRLASPYVVETDSTCGFDLVKDIGLSYGKTPAWVGVQENFNKADVGKYPGLGYSDESLLGRFVAGNDFNYSFSHASALADTQRYNIVSISSECCQETDIKGIAFLDIIFGNEKDDGYSLLRGKTFTSEIRCTIENYLRQGGKMLLSGSYITSDMLNEEEAEWMAQNINVRHCGVLTDTLPFRENPITDGIFTPQGSFQAYRHVNAEHYASVSSDVIIPAFCTLPEGEAFTPHQRDNGNTLGGNKKEGKGSAGHEEKSYKNLAPRNAKRIASYYTGETAALLVYDDSNHIVVMGFPFECIKTNDERSQLMKYILDVKP